MNELIDKQAGENFLNDPQYIHTLIYKKDGEKKKIRVSDVIRGADLAF